MFDTSRVVAIIPAREGSKRLPNKNTLVLAGKPMIAWTIEAALQSKYVKEVIVSTDSELIKEVAEKHGAVVPFIRPESLSGDMATTDDVLMHAINVLELSPSDILVLLQPTSPLRNVDDIDKALEELQLEQLKGVVSVCECEHSPLWANSLPDDLSMGDFIENKISTKRSQDLPVYYRLNGAIYAYRVSYLKKYLTRYYSDTIKASVMPPERSLDIDTKLDFKMAQCLFECID
ncbi:MAG: CMP-N-acetylneuraminic acid synthetase [Enterobacterales bacterium]|jgi:CMP-N-acetylneuraminic acid synthetase